MAETGLFDEPATIVGNTDKNVARALRLLEVTGTRLMKDKDWNVLQKEQTLTLIALQDEYDLTSAAVITDQDFDRFLEDTDWDRSNFRKMIQVSPSEWQILKSSVGTSVEIDRSIRKRGDNLVFHPVPSATDTVVFEYISNKWINSGGTEYSTFQADTDTTKFPEDLLEAGLKWRLKNSFGQKSATDLAEFEQLRDKYISADTPARTLIAGERNRFPVANIQDTDFG